MLRLAAYTSEKMLRTVLRIITPTPAAILTQVKDTLLGLAIATNL
jgi:hypothetical protein